MIKLLLRVGLQNVRGPEMEPEHLAALLQSLWEGGYAEHGESLYEVLGISLEEVEILVTEH